MSNSERFQLYARNPELLPTVGPQEAMEQLLLAKAQKDTFIFDYALSARALETWAINPLGDLPDPKAVRYSDATGEYTQKLLGATNNKIQQMSLADREGFDRLLYLSRIVYHRPDEVI